MGQTLTEWFNDAEKPLNAICVCSDVEVSKKKSNNTDDTENVAIINLALPASTDVDNILRQFDNIENKGNDGLTVFFSTYQSIDVVSKAQKKFRKAFDLIICDEAHRTTGVTLAGADESAFVKVHNNDFLRAKKRLYMTATPRIYSDDSKSKADQNDAVLCSMDDETLYGKEMHRLSFGQAVDEGLLADYKVLVLTLSDKDISPSVQRMVANKESSIDADDASKLIGCINALSKQIIGDGGVIDETDPLPMKRAVAFCQTISVSREISNNFNSVSEKYIEDLPVDKQEKINPVQSRHIDGTMNATVRDGLLGWLKEDSDACRILTNVRCLSEGVDVPSLDAVMFLSARNSPIDVVQSVGRVMRRSEGKKYGYIIIPVVIPSDISPEKALDDNTRFKVVWTVLNALRAHDDRFNATINKIDLNKKKPVNILVGRPDITFDENGNPLSVKSENNKTGKTIQTQLQLHFEELQDVVFARMVNKVGDRLYWEQWAKSVADIAEKQIARLNNLVEAEDVKSIFEEFLSGLKQNIHPEITKEQSIEMLSQHMITKPVFEALFQNYSFAEHNPISKAMQKMIDLLEAQAIDKDTQILDSFYKSVQRRVSGIDNAEGRQRVIIELYDRFFKTAFPKMAKQLGIVYTPVEVVDFIVHSVDDVLKAEFNRSLTDENVHILDPFTGTGTFICRLLQSKLIKPEDLKRKYLSEIHANEMVLLAYYIAAVNIENTYHDLSPTGQEYQNFSGICLTDTFQLGEVVEGDLSRPNFFPKNSALVVAQQKTPITVIMSNPPYSSGQTSANDNAPNQSYPKLEKRIAETYVVGTEASNKNKVYDSYIKAFRWCSDRLAKTGGVICFVSSAGWLDGNSMDGFRKCIETEFDSIYVFNLRGNQRTSGELSKKEGGKIFGSGSRAPIAITLLVRKMSKTTQLAKIRYHDIGDYLNKEEKLLIVKKFRSLTNTAMTWKTLKPNEKNDWINQRNNLFDMNIPLASENKFDVKSESFFITYSLGLKTSRDNWVYSSSKKDLAENMSITSEFYNEQINLYQTRLKTSRSIDFSQIKDYNSKKIKWSSGLDDNVCRGNKTVFSKSNIAVSHYRPYCKQFFYYDKIFIERLYQIPKLFPKHQFKNLIICVSGIGVTKEFSCLITDEIPDLEIVGKSQCFPMYYYEEKGAEIHPSQSFLLNEKPDVKNKFIRKDGVSDYVLDKAKKQYRASNITKEDVFFYVYGVLHSPIYRKTFSSDLKKELPRIPLVDNVNDFWRFSEAGKKLADLHLNYETLPAYPDVVVTGVESNDFAVSKMRFPQKGQKDTIIYNSKITVSGIPIKAYQYIVNGRSAIEWIMERYQVSSDTDSGITNDPNDWAIETEKPRYILDLLLSIINLSVQTVDVVDGLPKLKFE